MKAIKLPVSFSGGRLQTTTDVNTIIRQKIIDVLVTSKQERVMLPDYGGDAYTLLYEMMDPTVFADFKTDAIQELSRHVTGAQIIDIVINTGDALQNTIQNADYDTSVNITVYYRIPPQRATSVTFTVSEFLTDESQL